MVADLYQTNDMHKVQRVNMLLLHSMICKSKQINISTIAKTALSKDIVGESQLSIHLPICWGNTIYANLWKYIGWNRGLSTLIVQRLKIPKWKIVSLALT